MDSQAAIRDRDRLLPGGEVRREILGGHTSARLFDHADNCFRYLSLIKRRFASIRDCTERMRQTRVTEDFSGSWAAAINHQFMAIQSRPELILRTALPGMRCDRPNRKTFLRKSNGRGENLRHRKRAMLFDQVKPARAGAGHGHGMHVEWRQLSDDPLLV